jgi:methylated-DNA-[protein]-cysteine S-methyltransferase
VDLGMIYTFMDSPVGRLLLARGEEGLSTISFDGAPLDDWTRDDSSFDDARSQLLAYFANELRVFELPLAPRGTPFQLDVWRALQQTPYGQTRSYAQLAREIGRPNAVRAVGAANGANPIPIVVPCHRVIGSNGSLTGFGGGLTAKRYLLDLELYGGRFLGSSVPRSSSGR